MDAEQITPEQASELVNNGDGIITSGFVGNGFPEALAVFIEKRFIETGEPRGISAFFVAGQGDGKERGLNHFGHEGFLKFIIGSHFGLAPKVANLVLKEKVEAYALPQGVMSHLIRAASGNKPGIITHVGLGTFVDPRRQGGALNSISKQKFVELVEIEGREYLFYKSKPLKKANVALIRGTTADLDGNITMEKEVGTLEVLSIATLVRNNGGIVIAQVERVAEKGTLKPKDVKVPGHLVDYIVKSPSEDYHWQTFAEKYNPGLSGEIRVPISEFPKLPLNERKIIGRRGVFELKKGDIVNIGIGLPEAVASVAAEEKIFDFFLLTVEAGPIGGIPAGGLSFGASLNPSAIIDQPYQFDFYDGGGLDIAFLGMAEVDEEGNVNVSKFGGRLPGPGGFINISQNAKKVVFCGTLNTGAEITVENRFLRILKEGEKKKFVKEVEHVTFSGKYAIKREQEVFYVTERAVFKLTKKGVELIEIAPGVDLERGILSQMDFEPIVRETKQMNAKIFSEEIMGLRKLYESLGGDKID
ncbi:MAG: malonate decarboxylase subunit alpha [Archaeoglobaceae archaeon]|nr:malonate decarboxylase subunit alpha [Archaeoglobaceae archaeon]MDW8118741.1 malonate decarboxylase subunit alpha [Archaeoglobaceae archaeon]